MKNINYLASFFIIVFSGYYITKLPLSPIYMFIMIGSLLITTRIILSGKIKVAYVLVIAFYIFLYFLISPLISPNPNISAYVGFNFSIIVFIFSYISLSKLKTTSIVFLSYKFIYFSLPLLIFEVFYRYANPIGAEVFIKDNREDIIFYIYKYNSIMYLDSNFVGLFTISLFFFLLYLNTLDKRKSNLFIVLILALLTVLTLSRASIISLFLFSTIFPFRKFIYKNRYIIYIAIMVLISLLAPFLLEFRSIDDSFSSKFTIFEKALSYMREAPIINLFFGVGFGNAVEVLNIGAHNFIVTYLVESGFIGLFLIALLWVIILLKTKLKAGIIMFPFLFNGLSLSTGSIPYLYAIFAIMLVIETRKNKNVY